MSTVVHVLAGFGLASILSSAAVLVAAIRIASSRS